MSIWEILLDTFVRIYELVSFDFTLREFVGYFLFCLAIIGVASISVGWLIGLQFDKLSLCILSCLVLSCGGLGATLLLVGDN
jgi:hypothetical protein